MKRSANKKMKAMSNYITYLLQSAAIMAILYTVFWLFLRKDTFFFVNRAYLLLTILLSLTIPLFDLNLFAGSAGSPVMVMLDPVLITSEKIEKIASGHLSWFEIAGIIYITGVAIFSVRFLIQLIQLAFIIYRNKITRQEGANIVFVDRGYSPFSFFNLIFIRREYYIDGKLTPVLAHEKIHIRQYHTFDLLLAEAAIILQWFNPFAWFLGKSMKSIHEFLADEGVLKKGFMKNEYQTLILNEAMGMQVNNLTNNFNVSLIKNRITMMTKKRSASWTQIKVLAALPAFLAVLFFFTAGTANTTTAQETKTAVKSETEQQSLQQEQVVTDQTIFQVVEDMPEYPGGQDAMIKYLMENIKYPEEAKTKGITGTVYVTYVVEKDGSVTNVKVLRGIGGGCDEESVRVVKGMPKWIPGKQRGQNVRVQFNLPIKYALDDKGVKKEEEKK
jgi:TonB family protein